MTRGRAPGVARLRHRWAVRAAGGRYPLPVPSPAIVSFDCASTLLATDYSPEGFAMKAVRLAGYEPFPDAERIYRAHFDARLPRYVALNASGDEAGLAAFWRELTETWARGTPLEGREAELLRAADELLYSPTNRYFTVYDDVVPCLDALRGEGYRLVVLSNWDVTLPGVLRNAGLLGYFERVFASLAFGIEKPDVRFFRYAEEQCGAGPSDFVHVGDRMDDDVEGARAAGWGAYLIDRALPRTEGFRLATFADLPGALRSTG